MPLTLTSAGPPVAGGGAPPVNLRLDFATAGNSQYLYLLLEDWL